MLPGKALHGGTTLTKKRGFKTNNTGKWDEY